MAEFELLKGTGDWVKKKKLSTHDEFIAFLYVVKYLDKKVWLNMLIVRIKHLYIKKIIKNYFTKLILKAKSKRRSRIPSANNHEQSLGSNYVYNDMKR